MLFYKPLFSLVVAFAAAGSVVATASPVGRDDLGNDRGGRHHQREGRIPA